MANKFQIELGRLRCDALGCGYQDEVVGTWETVADNIGRPCPKCGASLLTKEDYATLMMLYGMAMSSGPSSGEGRVEMDIVMDGTGSATFVRKS